MKHVVTLAGLFCALSAEAAEIPFPSALDAAEVVESRITDLKREALVLGNGDLNALLWERDGTLCLRVTKNDIWDARIDTSRDPDLMTMDISKRTWRGGANRVPSWHGTPYPIPRCAAVIVIGELPEEASTAGSWRCVRSGEKNAWTSRDGCGAMSVAGSAGASAGYGCSIRGVSHTSPGSLKLRLSGTANARYFVDVSDSSGNSLVHSGWMDAPLEQQEASFSLPAGSTAVVTLRKDSGATTIVRPKCRDQAALTIVVEARDAAGGRVSSLYGPKGKPPAPKVTIYDDKRKEVYSTSLKYG